MIRSRCNTWHPVGRRSYWTGSEKQNVVRSTTGTNSRSLDGRIIARAYGSDIRAAGFKAFTAVPLHVIMDSGLCSLCRLTRCGRSLDQSEMSDGARSRWTNPSRCRHLLPKVKLTYTHFPLCSARSRAGNASVQSPSNEIMNESF